MKTTNTTSVVSLRTNRKNRKSGLRRSILATSAAALLLLQAGAGAANVTWNHGSAVNNNWSNGGVIGNWFTSAAPTNGDNVFFDNGAALSTANTNDIVGLTLNSITFNGAPNGTYTLSGNALTLVGGITNNTPGVTQTISFGGTGVTVGAVQTWTAAAGALNVTSAVALGGNQLTITGAQNTTLGGAVTGAGGSILKTGAGTLIMSSAGNNYNGATTVNAGTLQVNGTIANSIVSVNSGGTLTGTGTLSQGANLSGTGIINFGAGGNIVGSVSVNGGNWNGLGSAGPVNVNTGNLSIGAGANMTTTGVGLAVNNAATFSAAAANSTITGNVSYFSTANSTFQGIIAGAGSSVTVNSTGGAATLTLSGANTYGGATTVLNGTLQLGANSTLPTGTAVTVGDATTLASSNARLNLAGFNQAIASLTIVAPSGSSGNVDLNGGTLTVNGNISLVNNASTPGNGFSGNINSNGNAASRLDLGGAVRNFNAASQNIGTNSFGGDDLRVSAIIQNGGVTVNGTNSATVGTIGGVTFSAVNTYGLVTTINSGTLRATASTVAGNSSLGFGDNTAGTGTVVNTGGSLVLGNLVNITTEALTINGAGAARTSGNTTPIGALTLDQNGTASFGGPITVASNASISANGNGSVLNLNGPINKTGFVLTLTNLNGGTGTINVNGVISGNTGLFNSDLIVNGVTANLNAPNTYLGPTFITSISSGDGVLNANVPNAMPIANGRTSVTMDATGAGSSVFNIGGIAAFPLGASQSIASLAGITSSKVTLGNNTLTIGFGTGLNVFGTAGATFAGVISGTSPGFAIIKDDLSTQILTGINTYIGFTAVNGGTLQVGDGATANSQLGTGLVFVNPTGTLDINLANGGIFANTVQTAAGSTVRGINTGASGTQRITGAINGAGNFVQNAGGTSVFENVNTYTAGTRITGAGSTVVIGTTTAGSSAGQNVSANTVVVDNGGTLTLVNVSGGVLNNNITNGIGGAGQVISTPAAAVTTTLTGTLTDGAAGTLALTQNGAGKTVLSNAGNTYTGATIVSAGTLEIGTAGSGGSVGSAATTIVVSTGGTLSIVNIGGPTANTLGNNITNGVGGAGTVNVNSANTNTLTGVLSDGAAGTLALTQSGPLGTTILTGNNTYSGTTTIAAGTLQVGDNGVTASGTLGTGNVVDNGTLNFNRTDAAIVVNNVISGTGIVNVTAGANSVTLGGANSYGGATNVVSGTLILNNATALGTTVSGTNVAGGATLDLNGQNIGSESLQTGTGSFLVNNSAAGTAANVDGGVTLLGNTTVGNAAAVGGPGGNITLTGVVAGGAAASLIKVGTSTLTLTGANNYGGATTINAGILIAGNATALGNIGVGTTVANGASLQIANGIFVVAEPLTIVGAGAGAAAPGALTQAAGGTSSFSGPITVDPTNIAGGATINANGGALTLTGPINKTGVNLTLAGVGGAGSSITVNGVISGNNGALTSDLIVNGTTANLNAANTYLGQTFITSIVAGDGILNANVASALPTSPVRTQLIMDGAFAGLVPVLAGAGSSVLNLGTSQSVASLTGDPTSIINLGGNTLTIGFGTANVNGGYTNSNFAGVINGSAGLIKDETSTQVLSGANAFTGPVAVNGGILSLANGAALADVVAVTVTSPGVLNLINSEVIGSLAGNGNTTLNANLLTTGGNNTSTTYSGVMSGNGAASLIKTGTGTFTLSGANTFTGTAVVNNGVLQLQNGAAIADAVAVTVTSPGSLDLLNSEVIGSLAGNGNVTLNANLLTTGGNGGTTTYSGVMSGNGAASLIKTGAGVMTLSGANTFSGTAVVNNGTLSLQNGAAIADVVAVTVTNPGILNLVNSETIGSLAGNGNTTLNAQTLTTGGNNGTTTYSGITSGNGANALVKNGTGTMTLSGVNTFTGTAVVNDGTLSLSGGAAIANTVAVTVNNPVGVQFGTLNLVNSETIGSLAGAGNVTLNAQTLTTGGNNTSTTFSGIMSGNGANSLVKTGTGTFTLSGANTFTGTAVVNQGVLSLSGGAAIADVVAVTVTAPGSLNLASSETIGSLAGNGATTLNANTLTTGGNNGTTTYSGVMSGTGGLTKLGTGTMTLSGANTFSGPTAVNAGILSLTGGAALADTSAVTVTTPGTLDIFASETIASLAGTGAVTLNAQTLTTGVDNTSTTHSGVISGAGGALVKNGTGTFTVGGTNTYTGGTTLNAGTLAAANGSAFGNGNVTVNGGTLQTSGGPLIVNIGSGNFNINGGTIVALVGGTTPGVNHDQYKTTGTAGFNSTAGTLALVQQNGYLLAPGDKVNLGVATGVATGGVGVVGGTALGTTIAGKSASGVLVPNTNVTNLALFSVTPLLVPTVNLYPTTVTLEAVQGSFGALAPVLGFTPNQRAVAGALDSVAKNINFKTGIIKELNYLDVQPLSTLRSNLDKIAPEELTSIFHLGVSLANVNSNNLTRRMDDLRSNGGGAMPSAAPAGNQTRYLGGANGPVGRRSKEVAPPSDSKWGAFLTGSGEFTHIGSTSNAAGYNLNTGGVTAGMDYRVSDKFAVGLSLGYANTNASLVNGGSLDADGGRLGIYATYFDQNFHLDASVTGGINSYKTRRTTPNNTVATGSPDGTEINVLIGAGYDFKFGALTVGPVASYQYTNMHMDGFTETGLFAPLNVSGQSADSSRTSLGIRASFEGHIGSAIIRPEVRLAWQHEFGATSYAITSRFATIGGNPFTVTGTKVGRDSMLASAGFIIMWNERLGTYVYYDGNFGAQNLESHNISGGVRLQF